MPTNWGTYPDLGVDKNPTAIDRVIRKGWLMALVGVALVVGPVLLVTVLWTLMPGVLKSLLGNQFSFSILVMAVVLFIILNGCAICIWGERKIAGFIQDRMGPNRVGWGGLFQSVADGLKLFFKEEVIPRQVDKPVYILAPFLAFAVALLGFAIIPWAGEIVWPWTDAAGEHPRVTTQVASLDIGVLYLLAVGSLGVYGVVLAGWASNSKYSFYGGMRATAQMLSYEIPLGLAVLAVLLVAGTLRVELIQNYQISSGVWNILLHPIVFLILLVAAFAETNRAPFDVVEAEQELVGGYHTEYSALKFGLFLLGEYAHMMTNSAFIVALFLGGWAPLPFFSLLSDDPTWWNTSWTAALIKFGIFWAKVATMILLYMVVRWTLPRFRFDQLMRMAWKGLVPAGMVMVVVAAIMPALGWRIDPQQGFIGNLPVVLAYWVANGIVLGATLWFAGRSRMLVTGRQTDMPEIHVRPAG